MHVRTDPVLALLVVASPALAQEAVSARSGAETRVGWVGSSKVDRTPDPVPTLRPVNVADHGQIKLATAAVTTNRVAGLPECQGSGRRRLLYVAPGCRGADTSTLATDGGDAPRTYSIAVE